MNKLLKLVDYFYKAAATNYNYNKTPSPKSISLIENALKASTRFTLDKTQSMVAFPFKGEDTSEIGTVELPYTIYGEKVFVHIYDAGVNDQQASEELKRQLAGISSYVEIKKRNGRKYDVVIQLKGGPTSAPAPKPTPTPTTQPTAQVEVSSNDIWGDKEPQGAVKNQPKEILNPWK